MGRIDVAIEIHSPAQIVFSHLLDADKVCKWQAGLAGRQMISGTPGVGSIFRDMIRTADGQTRLWTGTITAYNPGVALTIQYQSGDDAQLVSYRLRETAQKTHLRMLVSNHRTARIRPQLPSWWNRRLLKDRVEKDMRRLKQAVESRAWLVSRAMMSL